MYKLPSQFDPTLRQALPSAGGGCSSCCCCCCVLSTIAAPILTSMHFYRIKPAVAPVEAAPSGDAPSESNAVGTTEVVNAPVNDHDRMLPALLGLVVLPLALWAKGQLISPIFIELLRSSANLPMLIFLQNSLTTLLVFGAVFAFAYKYRRNRAGKGFLTGVVSAVAYVAVNWALYWSHIIPPGFVSRFVYFVLLAIVGLLSSVYFYRLEPSLAAGAAMNGRNVGLQVSVKPPDRAGWAFVGFFAFPLALVVAWLVWGVSESMDYSLRFPTLVIGEILSVMAFSGLFALAYRRYQGRAGKGFGIGLLAAVLYLLACTMEFFIWMSFIK